MTLVHNILLFQKHILIFKLIFRVIGWLQFVNEVEDLQRFLRTGHYVTRFRALGICQRHFAPHQFATPDKTRLVRGAIPLFHDPDDALSTNLLPSG